MIVSAAAHYHHSHLTTAARSQVTCGRRRSLSLPVSPSLPLPLFWPCITSLCTPFLLPPPSPSDPSLPSVYLSFLHHPQLLSSGHCLEPQRIICAIHSFHLSLFLCACPPPGYSGLPGRLRIPNPPDQSFHSLRPRRTGMLRIFHLPVLESHCASIVAFAQLQHAPCGFPLNHHMLCSCTDSVTSAILTDGNPTGF